MSLIQIAAQELAAPRTHHHQANVPREFAAASNRANKPMSLTPTAFLLWDQIKCQFSLASSHDRMPELFFIGCEDSNALPSTRNRDVPLLCARCGTDCRIGEQNVINCLSLRAVRGDCVTAEELPIM